MNILKGLDAFEELEIKALLDRQRELHLPIVPVSYWRLLVTLDGKEHTLYEARSKSWVRNMYNLISMQMMGLMCGALGTSFGTGTMVMRNTAGTLYSAAATTAGIRVSASGQHAWGAAASAAVGIVIGTNDAAESFDHHAMQTICSEGTGANQLNYLAMSAPSASYDAESKKLTQVISRNIVNNSPAAINISEIGMYYGLQVGNATTATITQFLVARDLVDPVVVLPVSGNLTAEYTVEITYPV